MYIDITLCNISGIIKNEQITKKHSDWVLFFCLYVFTICDGTPGENAILTLFWYIRKRQTRFKAFILRFKACFIVYIVNTYRLYKNRFKRQFWALFWYFWNISLYQYIIPDGWRDGWQHRRHLCKKHPVFRSFFLPDFGCFYYSILKVEKVEKVEKVAKVGKVARVVRLPQSRKSREVAQESESRSGISA